MPDISKCSTDESCYLRTTCYRYFSVPCDYQSYMGFSNADGQCKDYWERCKHIHRIGSGCSLNNNCKFPDCDDDGPLKPIYKVNNGDGATLCHHCRKIISTGKPTEKIYCKECQEKRDIQLKQQKQ